jgi:hypothetical protein
MVLIGIFVDWQLRLNWLSDLSGLPLLLRLLVDVIGVLLMGLGTALYIAPHMGAGPRDGLMLRLHALTKVRISIVRATLECFVLIIGFLLGWTVGVGTLIFAFGIGPAVEISFSLIKKLRFIDSLQSHLASATDAINRVPTRQAMNCHILHNKSTARNTTNFIAQK